MMPVINKSLINADDDDDYYVALVARHHEADKNHDTLQEIRIIFL